MLLSESQSRSQTGSRLRRDTVSGGAEYKVAESEHFQMAVEVFMPHAQLNETGRGLTMQNAGSIVVSVVSDAQHPDDQRGADSKGEESKVPARLCETVCAGDAG